MIQEAKPGNHCGHSSNARVIRDETKSPKLGEPAPDLELEKLDAQGNRTGQMARLSDHFGKPIGLVFGSYT